jgi:hypothetical protein
LDRPLADPLSETKNWRNLLTGKCGSQVSHSLPAHLERFITDDEAAGLRFHFETSKRGGGGRRYLPYAFTEQGVFSFPRLRFCLTKLPTAAMI